MNRTSLNTIALVSVSIALSACNKSLAPTPDVLPKPPATSDTQTDRPKAPASNTQTTAQPSGPIAPVNPSDEIPPGPYYPPARSNIDPDKGSWNPKVLLRKIERFFKDAVPAGENRSVHPTSVAEEEPTSIRGKFTADQLRPALRQNTANEKLIGMILDKRSGNEVTKRLKTYLAAEDPKTAASAAENVIEEIFATDRKPEVKLYELAGDFDEIQRMGYYDEAIAGRRDFLQARLDQAWSSNKAWSSDLPTAILVDVAPALLIGLAAGFRAPVLDTAVGLTEGAARGASRLAPMAREAGPVLSRNFRLVVTEVMNKPAAEAVEAKLLQIGIEGLPVTKDTLSNIKKGMLVGGVQHKLNWEKTPHPDFQYAVTRYFNGVENAGEFVVFRYAPMGLTKKIAMTNRELSPAMIAELEQKIQSSRGSVTKITKDGLEASDLPIEAIRTVAPSGKAANAPRAFREGEDVAETAVKGAGEALEAGSKPRAFRMGDEHAQARIIDDPVEAPLEKGAHAASVEGSIYKEPRPFETKRAVAGFVGGAALMAYPATVYYGKGSLDGQEREILYLGGQYDKYVPPAKTEKTQLTSELKEQ